MMDLTPTERRLYDILRQKAGDVVPYSELDRAISCRKSRENLRSFVRKLRRLGVVIQTVNRTGYRLRYRKKAMPTKTLNLTAQIYADEIQTAIHGTMTRHAREVGLESQISIMGVAIGAMLAQLPDDDRKYYTRLLLKNVADAPQLSQLVRVQ